MKKGAIELAQEYVELLREESAQYLTECRLLAAQEKDDLALRLEESIERILRHRGANEDWAMLQGAVVSMRYAG